MSTGQDGRSGLSRSQASAQARREKFCELRRGGLGMWEAAREVGAVDQHTARRYERWFQVAESGQEIILGQQGRHTPRG